MKKLNFHKENISIETFDGVRKNNSQIIFIMLILFIIADSIYYIFTKN